MKIAIIEEAPSYSINELGEVRNIKSGLILKQHISIGGYYMVYLVRGSRSDKTRNRIIGRNIHRLLMIHFVPNPENHPVIHHKDDNKLNYSLDNLEWCTHKYNVKKAHENGRCHVTQKMRDTSRENGYKRRKLILDIETGIYYHGVKAALESLPIKICCEHLAGMLNGRRRNTTSLRYV